MSLKTRRKRPMESQFDPVTLAGKWDELAKLRHPGFVWDGSGYGSTRTQALDEDTMEKYEAPLRILLELAPSGFPAHKCLVDAFEKLHDRHGILVCDSRFANRTATLASENWRVMTKHIYNAAMVEKVLKKGSLQALVQMIRLPTATGKSGESSEMMGSSSSSSSQSHDARSAADMSASAVQELFNMTAATEEIEDGSESEVQLCSIFCKCPECTKAIVVDDDEEKKDDEEKDPLMEIPSAAIGGQKRDTKMQARPDALDHDGKTAKVKGKGGAKVKGQGANKAPRLRIRGKRSPDVLKGKGASKQKVQGKGKRKAKGTGEDTQNVDGTDIAIPTKLVVRRQSEKRPGEAYLLDSSGSYVVGLTAKKSDRYESLVRTVQAKINSGEFKTKVEAKMWFGENVVQV